MGGTNLKTKGELLGREAPGRLLLPAHFQAFESPQTSVPELAAVRYYPNNSKGPSTRERVLSR